MRRFLLAPLPLLFACATSGDAIDLDEETQTAVVEGSPQALGVLAVANTLDQATLDDDVGLDARAAKNIVKRRNGADALLGTSDDNRYDTIAELDAVPYVAAAAFAKLLAYAEANGYVPAAMTSDWELENPSPDETVRTATFALSSTNAWAVGANGLAEHFDGTTWTVVPTGVTADLGGVWGASANDVWVVGAAGTILRWNGTAFTKQITNQTRTYHAVHGSSANDVWIVGGSDGASRTGELMHWNGTTLAPRTNQFCSYGIYTVYAASPTNVWLGGGQQNACQWNGTSWVDRRMNNSYYDAVSSLYVGPTKAYAVYLGDIYRNDGASWTRVYGLPDIEGWEAPSIRELTGRGDNDIWATGSHGFVVHFDGQTWTPTRIPGNADYSGIALAGTNEAWTVGASARARLKAGQWREDYAVVTRQWLRTASATSPTNIWALGSMGDIVRRTASGWQRVESPLSPDTDDMEAVLALADNDVWFGGYWRSAHWNGTTFDLVPELTGIKAMWAASRTNIWAVGEYGVMFHYDGLAWTKTTPPVSGDFRSISGTSANDIWIAGGTQVLHYNGTAWSAVDIGLAQFEETSTVLAIAPNDVWITGEQTYVRHFDGTAWTKVTATTKERPWIRSGWAAASNDVWFVVEDSELLHWTGSAFEHEPMDNVSTLVHTGGRQWALHENGTIKRR